MLLYIVIRIRCFLFIARVNCIRRIKYIRNILGTGLLQDNQRRTMRLEYVFKFIFQN